MPEDPKKPSSSGHKPEERKIVARPHVMNVSDAPQPTSTRKVVTKPKVIVLSKIIKPPKAVRSQRPEIVNGATVVKGVERKRIRVTLGELRALCLTQDGTETEVLEKAQHIIQVTNLEEADEKTFVFWGQKSQDAYGKLVSQSLELSISDVLSGSISLVEQLQKILTEVDVVQLATGSGNIFSRICGTAKGNAIQSITEISTNIEQIVAGLRPALPKLLKHKQKLETVQGETDKIAIDIEADAVSAEFLAGYIQREYATEPTWKSRADALAGRSQSLTRTISEIVQTRLLRNTHNRQPLQLIDCIQHTVLETVPTWLSSFASIADALKADKKPNQTAIDQITAQLERIRTTLV